jgi:hypothetical protein
MTDDRRLGLGGLELEQERELDKKQVVSPAHWEGQE